MNKPVVVLLFALKDDLDDFTSRITQLFWDKC
jgi:hypothetical protein